MLLTCLVSRRSLRRPLRSARYGNVLPRNRKVVDHRPLRRNPPPYFVHWMLSRLSLSSTKALRNCSSLTLRSLPNQTRCPRTEAATRSASFQTRACSTVATVADVRAGIWGVKSGGMSYTQPRGLPRWQRANVTSQSAKQRR